MRAGWGLSTSSDAAAPISIGSPSAVPVPCICSTHTAAATAPSPTVLRACVTTDCCAAEQGSGHRRLQQGCAIPSTCPSPSCAATFAGFFDACSEQLAATLPEQFPTYTALYADCASTLDGGLDGELRSRFTGNCSTCPEGVACTAGLMLQDAGWWRTASFSRPGVPAREYPSDSARELWLNYTLV